MTAIRDRLKSIALFRIALIQRPEIILWKHLGEIYAQRLRMVAESVADYVFMCCVSKPARRIAITYVGSKELALM